MSGHTYGPGEIAVRGEAIYRERIRQLVEPAKKGSFVVIDVETGDYEVDAGDAAATSITTSDSRRDAYRCSTGGAALLMGASGPLVA